MARVGWNTEILSWMLKTGLLERGDLNRGENPIPLVLDVIAVRARAVGGNPKDIRVEKGSVETKSRFGWTPIGTTKDIRGAALFFDGGKPRCLECSRPAEYGVYCAPCKGRLGKHAFTKSEVPKKILRARGWKANPSSDAEAYSIHSEYMNSARNIDVEAGAGWRAERDRLLREAKKYERAAKRYSETLYRAFKASRSSKSNPLSCWNCRTSLRSGQDICPTCSAGQHDENPLDERESRATLGEGIHALRSSRDAAPGSAEMGYQLGRAIGYTTPVQRFGTGASRKRAERVRGLAREKARQEGVLVKRRNSGKKPTSCRECFERPGTSREVPGLCHWCANLVAGDLEAERRELDTLWPSSREFPEMKNPVAVEAYHGKGTPIFVEPSRQIGSNPSSCKRCHGNCQVRLGKNIIPCPVCQRKHKHNPLTPSEVQRLDDRTRQIDRNAREAERRADEKSKIALSMTGRLFEGEYGRAAMRDFRTASRYDGRAEGILEVIKTIPHTAKRRRNPLDSHKPGCRCIFHSGKIFQKGPKK